MDGRPASPRRTGRSGEVTIRDVAARAGVSVSTVSNVLNHPEVVARDKIRRVEHAIEELGWTRNQGARQLGGGRSSAVGVIVAELNAHSLEVVNAVEDCLDRHGLVTQTVTTRYRSDRQDARVALFEQQRVRGILISPTTHHPDGVHLHQPNIPVVLLGTPVDPSAVCSVTTDGAAGAGLAVAHLLGLGHRRLAIVGGTTASHQVTARIRGARGEVPPEAQLAVIPTDSYDIGAGREIGRRLAEQDQAERPTALLAVNDTIAIGLELGLRSAGLSVPADVSVVGFDDIDLAVTAPVPLTTVRASSVTMGTEAALLLLQELHDIDAQTEHSHRQVVLHPTLVLRESTAAAPR